MLKLIPLPVTWLVFWLLGTLSSRASISTRRYVVAAASLALLLGSAGIKTTLFFGVIGGGVLLMASLAARLSSEKLRRIWLIFSIAALVAMIGVFLAGRVYLQKFFVYLPSLSYLGFRAISHVVSAYRRRQTDTSTGLMQMFFFPMLFMGPISRTEDFEKDHWDYNDVLRRLATGFAMLIAGHLCGGYVLNDYETLRTQAVSAYWIGAVANSFEFYFTFAGYSHLIIGLGLLTGFKLPENFNNPYMALSISDFWRRWHISLSFWIRDYLYFPLGGNRKGLARKCANMMVAMGLCGIWHGLNWHYLVWGLFHGALLAGESVMTRHEVAPMRALPPALYRPLKMLLIFGLVTFGWLLFKYPLPQFVQFVEGMVGWSGVGP